MAKLIQKAKKRFDWTKPTSLMKCVREQNQIYRRRIKTQLVHRISSIFKPKCNSAQDKRGKKHQFHGGRFGKCLAGCCPGRLGRLFKKVSIEEVVRVSSTSSESENEGRWDSLCKEANTRYVNYLMDHCIKKYHNTISPCGDVMDHLPSQPILPPASLCAPNAPCNTSYPEYESSEEDMPSFESSSDSLPSVMYLLELESDENCNNLSPDSTSSFWCYSDSY